MLKSLRQQVIQHLWQNYHASSWQAQKITTALKKIGISHFTLDHFAVIDLPGPQSGIPHLQKIFSSLGYVERGKDYLAEKQNDFLWMAECDSEEQLATDVLPQVVIADFRPDEMPPEIRKIITTYADCVPASPLSSMQTFTQQLANGDEQGRQKLLTLLSAYFQGRDWPLPTVKEFRRVQEFNELLAWVLIFGRRPNHFTLSIHLLNHFADLQAFHQFIEADVQLALNSDGGIIKGGSHCGIAQGSTLGKPQTVQLSDGSIELAVEFVEFVWRYPRLPTSTQPKFWKDFFPDFIARHADKVIESLYE